jgi:hypothetical protein
MYYFPNAGAASGCLDLERFTRGLLRTDLPAKPCRETGAGGLCPPPPDQFAFCLKQIGIKG